jgi:8-oxo-dGTP pyrophosphatase MutT (NUDIX family)
MLHFLSWIENIQQKLNNPLPAKEAHIKLAPPFRFAKENLDKFIPNDTTRTSAVLILLYPNESSVFCPLMQRPQNTGVHSGQISLAGGKKEDDDEDFLATALRETEEELGVNVPRNNFLGQLSPLYIPPSNFLVYPQVAFLDKKPDFLPNNEVAELLELDILDFVKNDYLKYKIIEASYMKGEMPYYDVLDKTLWGATAMILSELKAILA